MRYMGIDYGTKRVGIALSDREGRMAFPHAVFKNDGTLVRELAALATKEKVDAIVFGASRNLDGGANPVQERIDECIADLTLELGIPIHEEPEVYSTQEALRDQGRTPMTDASAAAIILNSFLTKQRHD